jgi:hypothetical protein
MCSPGRWSDERHALAVFPPARGRRVLEIEPRREEPFVALRPHVAVIPLYPGVRFRRQGERETHSPVRRQQMLADWGVVEPRAIARLELVSEYAVDLAVHRAAHRKDETRRIPEQSAEPRQSLPRAAGEAGEECAYRAADASGEGSGRKRGRGDYLKDKTASAGVDVHECHR